MIEFVSSPRETARFGLRIGRATVARVEAEEIISALERESTDVAILRLPGHAIGAVDELRRHGFAPIIADTLVRYEIDLLSRQPSAGGSQVVLRPATRSDAGLLESMTRQIFAGYVSHYNANPRFQPDKILDGYAEWATSHLDSADDAAGAWLVESNGEVVGFSCYRLDAETGVATGVLNGIVPGARGKGNYRAMLRRMLDHFAVLGARRFSIATQLHNVGVQRTWATEGLVLGDVSNTVHINLPREKEAVTEASNRQAESSR